MTTRYLILTLLIIGGIIITSCQKESVDQPASSKEAISPIQAGNSWDIQSDPITNHPDPFIERTIVVYRLQKSGFFRLSVAGESISGIRVLVDSYAEAGIYRYEFDGGSLKPGKYTLYLCCGGKVVKEQLWKIAGLNQNPLTTEPERAKPS